MKMETIQFITIIKILKEMKKYHLRTISFKYIFIVLVTTCISMQAQKVKVKKGDILVDKVKVGHIEKIKVKNDSLNEAFYKIVDNSGRHIFNFRNEFIVSPLFLDDKKYFFHTIEYVIKGKRAAIQDLKYYPTEKQMAKYLISSNLLDNDGVNDSAIEEFIISKDILPPNLQKIVKEEEELKAYASFKVDRLISDPVFVFFDRTTSGTSAVSDGMVTKSRYNIFQGIKDPKTNEFISKTFIGYAIAEDFITSEKVGWYTNPPKDYRPNPKDNYKLIVYNTKGVPLASYQFLTYKTYHPYEIFGPTKTDLRGINSVEERIKYIDGDLIEKNIL